MKNILSFIVLFLFFLSHTVAQNPPQKVNANYQFQSAGADSSLRLPKRSAFNRLFKDTGTIRYDASSKRIHWTTDSNSDATFSGDQGVGDSLGTFQMGDLLFGNSNSALKSNRSITMNAHRLWFRDSTQANGDSNYVAIWDTVGFDPPQPVLSPVGVKIRLSSLFAPEYMSFQPWNYGVKYTSAYKTAPVKALDFNFGISPNESNGGDGPPDNVFGFGYNIKDGTSIKDTSDGAVNFAVETSFLNVLGRVQPNFEIHWPRVYDWSHVEHRVQSMYVGKIDGYCLWESNLNIHEYKFPSNGWNYMTVTDFQGGQGNGKIDFTSSAAFDFTGSIDFDNAKTATHSDIRDNDGNIFIEGADQGVEVQQNGTTMLGQSGANVICGKDSTNQNAALSGSELTVYSLHHAGGFVAPRMTTSQKTSISSPAEGVLVYDLTLHQYSYWNGSAWTNF